MSGFDRARYAVLAALLSSAQLGTVGCECWLQDAASELEPRDASQPTAASAHAELGSAPHSAQSEDQSAASELLRVRLPTGPIRGKQVGLTREFLGIPYRQAAARSAISRAPLAVRCGIRAS